MRDHATIRAAPQIAPRPRSRHAKEAHAMDEQSQILMSVTNRVATITLNRPDRLNAWTPVMADALRAAVARAEADADVRCIVLTGAGRGFCAGADMGGLQGAADTGGIGFSGPGAQGPGAPEAPGPDLTGIYPGRFGYLYECPKPVIAMINGPIAGIGLVLALYADLRFAAAEAKFTTAFAARGLIAEHGAAWLLPRLIGEAAAMDLLLTARVFDGAEAAALGMVNKALPGQALGAHVDAVAHRLAHEVSPRSLAVMKRQLRRSYAQSFAASLGDADEQMRASFASPDFKEGVQSYVERRTPRFADL
jgi:enoyl-CoA hydratase/carnithine racemase